MAEYQLLKNYLYYVRSFIYTSCTSIIAYRIIDTEAEILNHLNETYYGYGKEFQFYAGKDCIVSLEDVHNFYLFLEVCYKKLVCNTTSGYKDKCGFIQLNHDISCCLPYCTQGGQRYVPLLYLDGSTQSLAQRAIKLEKWNLAYLKFCCRIHGIKDELFYGSSWLVVSLDDVKNSFPPETDYTDIWPNHLAAEYFLNNQNTFQSNPPDSWITAVLEGIEVVPEQNTIPDTAAAAVSIHTVRH